MQTDIRGEARIPLSSLHELLNEKEAIEQERQEYKTSISMFGEFLQFLQTKQYFDDIVDEFNKAHDRLSIKAEEIEGTDRKRVRIYLDNDEVDLDEREDL